MKPVEVLAELFRRNQCDEIESLLDSVDPSARRMLLRSLLVHPSTDVRTYALARVDRIDLWTVIGYPHTPIPILHRIFEHVRVDAPPEYLKVFFLCAAANLQSASTAPSILDAFALLNQFYHISCFHEDVVFEPLIRLDRTLIERGHELGLSARLRALRGEHVDPFLAIGSEPNIRPENMMDIPLPIQRRMARQGHFLSYFVSHPKEKVAMETLRHLLRLEEVTSFLKIRTIHRRVLRELAKHRRFFFREEARLALLHNPKLVGAAASRYLMTLSVAQLRGLSRDKNANLEVRQLASKRLNKLRG